MSIDTQINADINRILDGLQAREAMWEPRWIAHQIVNAHCDAISEGEDANWWRHVGYTDIRRRVTKVINVRGGLPKAGDEAQPRLPGYDHVQAYYVVKRDGGEVGVPAGDLTDDEIHFKADALRKMGDACYAHADDLYRYKRERRQAVAA